MPDSDAKNLSEVVAYLGIEDSFDTPLEAILEMRHSLYSLIEHGDEQHRKWLRDKLDEFFLTDRTLPDDTEKNPVNLPESNPG